MARQQPQLAHDGRVAQGHAEHPEINAHVSRAQLDAFCDPANYLSQAGVMVGQVLALRR